VSGMLACRNIPHTTPPRRDGYVCYVSLPSFSHQRNDDDGD
jgi:hypothetical protein